MIVAPRMMCIKYLQMDGWILNFFKNRKNSKFCPTASLTTSLPDHICKPRRQTKYHTAASLQHNNKLISEMCLLGFRQVWGLCTSSFLLSSIRLFFFFMQQNHSDVLIFQLKLSLNIVSSLKNINYKAVALL